MNATAATPAGIVTAARWLSQGFPILAGLLVAAGLGCGSPGCARPSCWAWRHW